MENWEKAKLIADKFGVLQKEDGDINYDVLLAIESALSQHDVNRQSELLLCQKCKSENIIESFPHHNRYTCFDCKTEGVK